MMDKSYKDKEMGLNIPQDNKKAINFYKGVTPEELFKISEGLFEYFLDNEKEKKFRHLLTFEQFPNKEASNLLFKRYYLEPIKYQTIIFKELIKNKIIHQSNSSIVALQFFSPIYILIINCKQGFLLKSEA